MTAALVVLLLLGIALAWGGPVDPERGEDWLACLLGAGLAVAAFWCLIT